MLEPHAMRSVLRTLFVTAAALVPLGLLAQEGMQDPPSQAADAPNQQPPSPAYLVAPVPRPTVVLSPGAIYGPAGEGWFRISLTTPDDRLLEAVERLGSLARR